MADESTIAVMADAQAGLARVIKPVSSFEALYQGEFAEDAPLQPSRPVAFYEWKNGRPPSQFDPLAGRPNFDPLLLNYLPVSMGAQLLLGIPLVGNPGGAAIRYRYRILWRWTSLARFSALVDSQYHLLEETVGAADTSPGGGPRFVLPGAQETALITPFVGALDGTLNDTVTLLRSDVVQNELHLPGLPIVAQPGAVGGHYQQGIVDPALFPGNYAFSPVFALVPVMAKGDRMLIVADRPVDAGAGMSATWNFSTGNTDEGFSRLYGNGSLTASPHPPFPTVGIYVFQVTSPCCTTPLAEGVVTPSFFGGPGGPPV